MPPREPTQSSTAASRAAAIFNSAAMIADTPVRRLQQQRRLSSFDMGSDDAAVSASGILSESAVGPPLGAPDVVLPGSFTSQLALATAMNNARATANLALAGENDRDRDRMSRLVLARMKTLEESFTDVVHELRSLQKQQQAALASGQVSAAASERATAIGLSRSGRTSAVVSGRASAAVSSSEGEMSSHGTRPAPRPVQGAEPSQRTATAPALSRMPTVLGPSAPTPAPPQTTTTTTTPTPLTTVTTATPQTTGTTPAPVSGTNTPKSPTGSRIPISATLSNLGMSSPPGPSSLPRVSSGVMRPAVRPAGGDSNDASESQSASQSQSRVPRRAKGKEVERRTTVVSDDDDGESFYRM